MNSEYLKPLIARAVLRAPDINPKKNELSTHEVAYTLRPSWSKVGRYEVALPGGGIVVADFAGLLSPDQLADPEFIPSTDMLIEAGLKAVERELFEELELTAVGLFYVDTSENKAGWITRTYAAELEQKPKLVTQPDSAGSRWVDQERIINGNPKMLSGHLGMTRRAIKALDAKKSS